MASSDCARGAALLDRYIFPSIPRIDRSEDEPHLRIRIDCAGAETQLIVDGFLKQSASQSVQLVPELIRAMDEAVLHHLNGLWAVHAGAVQWGDRVLLLPGGTHSGKSSLVAELLRRGAVYHSDEYALIDMEGRAHPYPRPLLLRNGKPEQVPALPEDYSAATGTSPAKIGWIFALNYKPEGSWQVEAIPQSAGLITLLRNTPHVLSEIPNMMTVFERAVADAQCYSGQRSSAEHAADVILEMLERSVTPVT